MGIFHNQTLDQSSTSAKQQRHCYIMRSATLFPHPQRSLDIHGSDGW